MSFFKVKFSDLRERLGWKGYKKSKFFQSAVQFFIDKFSICWLNQSGVHLCNDFWLIYGKYFKRKWQSLECWETKSRYYSSVCWTTKMLKRVSIKSHTNSPSFRKICLPTDSELLSFAGYVDIAYSQKIRRRQRKNTIIKITRISDSWSYREFLPYSSKTYAYIHCWRSPASNVVKKGLLYPQKQLYADAFATFWKPSLKSEGKIIPK